MRRTVTQSSPVNTSKTSIFRSNQDELIQSSSRNPTTAPQRLLRQIRNVRLVLSSKPAPLLPPLLSTHDFVLTILPSSPSGRNRTLAPTTATQSQEHRQRRQNRRARTANLSVRFDPLLTLNQARYPRLTIPQTPNRAPNLGISPPTPLHPLPTTSHRRLLLRHHHLPKIPNPLPPTKPHIRPRILPGRLRRGRPHPQPVPPVCRRGRERGAGC